MFSARSRSTLVAALALAATAAHANPFSGLDGVTGDLTFQGASDGYSTVNITFPGMIGGSPRNVSTGQFKGFFDPSGEDGTSGAEGDDFFRFFCIDLYHWAYGGMLTYARTTLDPNTTDGWQLTRLFENVYPNQDAGNFFPGSSSAFGDFPDAKASAAMQLAIWEIWFDDGLSLSGGSLKATDAGSVVATAQGYLDAIGNGPHSAAPGWQLYQFTSATNQDYLAATYSTPLRTQDSSVPLPGTLALLGIGLAGLAASRRRKQ